MIFEIYQNFQEVLKCSWNEDIQPQFRPEKQVLGQYLLLDLSAITPLIRGMRVIPRT